jgi:ribosomal protein S18 acetylase RimI-like enzyme
MALDLRALNESIETPPNLRITVIENQEMLRTYATVSMRGFDTPEEENTVYYDTYVGIGSGDDLPWQHYIGWLDEQPVAVSSLLLHVGVAGIYGVATVPEARRQGIGAAMTLAPLREARARLCHRHPLALGDGPAHLPAYWLPGILSDTYLCF